MGGTRSRCDRRAAHRGHAVLDASWRRARAREAVRAAFAEIFEQFPNLTWETYRVLYGEDHWILDWALISGDIRFDCLDVVNVSPDGLVARKDTFVDAMQLQAALGAVTA